MFVEPIFKLRCLNLNQKIPFSQEEIFVKHGKLLYFILTLGLGSFIKTIRCLLMFLDDQLRYFRKRQGIYHVCLCILGKIWILLDFFSNLAIYLRNFAYLWYLVWIHKDPSEYTNLDSEIVLFFMSKLGIWFPLGM